jgi:RNA polymerase sigma-70 factor (ECF subfamily)
LSIADDPSPDRESSDSRLVALAAHGDSDALEVLLERHYDRLHGICRRILGNDPDAEDATQEALIAIVRGLAGYDGRSSFSTWAYRVATNAALDELRRRRRRPAPGLSETPDAATSADRFTARFLAGEPWIDPADTVSARLDVDAALQQIPEDQRAAVVLRDLLDLDYAQIADVLSIPVGTVRSRIARGRAAIASLLEPEPWSDSAPTGGGQGRRDQGNSSHPPERQRTQKQ